MAAGTYYMAGYLYTPSGAAVFSHLDLVTMTIATADPELYADRPDVGKLYRGADRDDPVDGGQRRQRQFGQPGLRHDQQLGQPQVDRDQRGQCGRRPRNL